MQQFASTMAPNLPPPLISIQVICFHTVNCTCALTHFALTLGWVGPIIFSTPRPCKFSVKFLVLWTLTQLRIWEQLKRSSTTRPSVASLQRKTPGAQGLESCTSEGPLLQLVLLLWPLAKNRQGDGLCSALRGRWNSQTFRLIRCH